jgi:hypothetical protein
VRGALSLGCRRRAEWTMLNETSVAGRGLSTADASSRGGSSAPSGQPAARQPLTNIAHSRNWNPGSS